MPLPIVVPDASVLLKWVLPSTDERDADQALLLRTAILEERVRALVPTLWVFEVANTVSRRFPAHAAGWLSALRKFSLEEARLSDPWLAEALQLVDRFGCTFYDASYHAVALVNGGVFVTLDSQYVKLAGDAGGVVALGKWQAPSPRRAR